MVSPYKLRDLFKPVVNTASRAAYRMSEGIGDAYRKSKQNPYVMDATDKMAGNQGRFKQGLTWGYTAGVPLYAGSKLAGLVPERTEEVKEEVKEEVTETTEGNGTQKDSVLITADEEKEIIPEQIEIEESAGSDGALNDAVDIKSQALVDQTNLYAGEIDNDSIARIEGYKDIIRNFMGSGDEGSKMQKMALLMNVGSALMSGRTDQPGIGGFFDVIGQTGMQTAPMLFEMGVEKGKAEREIGAAALNMYLSELDKSSDVSGPFTMIYENTYERGDDGRIQYNARGEPIVKSRRRIGTDYRKSPKIMSYMDLNNELGFEKFTFEDSSTEKAGMAATGMGQQLDTTQETKASRDKKRNYASYLGKTLDVMADFVMPTIIRDKDTLTGFWGQVGRDLGPKFAAAQAIMDGVVLDGMGGQANLDNAYNEQINFMTSNNYIVNREANHYEKINGKQVGFFIDVDNEYGFNENTDADGKGGTPTYLATKGGMSLLLENPNRSAMITFENTIGLALSRDRQPTGRMLADILGRSFADTQMTSYGFGKGKEAVSTTQVLSNYTFIFNQLAENRANALRDAGLTNDPNEKSREYSPDDFRIKGIDKYMSSWYQLRAGRGGGDYATHDIYGQPTYASWKQSMMGNINMDRNENKASTDSIVNKTMDVLNN